MTTTWPIPTDPGISLVVMAVGLYRRFGTLSRSDLDKQIKLLGRDDSSSAQAVVVCRLVKAGLIAVPRGISRGVHSITEKGIRYHDRLLTLVGGDVLGSIRVNTSKITSECVIEAIP